MLLKLPSQMVAQLANHPWEMCRRSLKVPAPNNYTLWNRLQNAIERRFVVLTGCQFRGNAAPLVDFYSNVKTDCSGRYLSEILLWDHRRLENCHNYIQWLFPTSERSRYNFFAPVLDSTQSNVFRKSTELKKRVFASFAMMCEFYGYKITESGDVLPAENFSDRTSCWITPRNHNFLRLSRMMKSLHLLGLSKLSISLGDQLVALCDVRSEIGEATGNVWSLILIETRRTLSTRTTVC